MKQSQLARGGKIVEPILKNPPHVSYIPPHMRTLMSAHEQAKQSEPPAQVELENDGVIQEPAIVEALKKSVSSSSNPKVPFPDRLEKCKDDKQFAKFLDMMRDVQITIPILDAVLHVPMYAKFFKELLTKKRSLEEPEIVTLTKECSAIIHNNLPTKRDDPGSFSIPCIVGSKKFTALCDLGSSVSVLPLSTFQMFSLGELKQTSMTLQLADRTLKKPAGILIDVPVVVGEFAYPVDFVILEMDDKSDAMILGRTFLATAGAIIDVPGAKLTVKFGHEEIEFDMRHPTHLPRFQDQCLSIDMVDHCVNGTYERCQGRIEIDADLSLSPAAPVISEVCSFSPNEDKETEITECDSELVPNVVEELKPLPSHLRYAFLEKDKVHPVIVSAFLSNKEEEALLVVLDRKSVV